MNFSYPFHKCVIFNNLSLSYFVLKHQLLLYIGEVQQSLNYSCYNTVTLSFRLNWNNHLLYIRHFCLILSIKKKALYVEIISKSSEDLPITFLLPQSHNTIILNMRQYYSSYYSYKSHHVHVIFLTVLTISYNQFNGFQTNFIYCPKLYIKSMKLWLRL